MEWAIPAVEIKDSPRFGWRGLMLDVSRHFYDKDEVKELLDLMALYKMNKFHWHLTDDQGWRVEIKKYPLLTEKGAWRKYNSHDKTCLELAKRMTTQTTSSRKKKSESLRAIHSMADSTPRMTSRKSYRMHRSEESTSFRKLICRATCLPQ